MDLVAQLSCKARVARDAVPREAPWWRPAQLLAGSRFPVDGCPEAPGVQPAFKGPVAGRRAL